MNSDIKEKIRNIVSIFYRNPFKIFYINSNDSKIVTNPIGYFVSLGITTSSKVLDDIRAILEENGYTAFLCEISSKRLGNQFINTITNADNPQQYIIDKFDEDILGEKESKLYLKELREKLNVDESVEELKTLVYKISQLEDLINRLDRQDGWGIHMIRKTSSGFSLFHRQVNYKVEGDLEYRLGIYVSEDCD